MQSEAGCEARVGFQPPPKINNTLMDNGLLESRVGIEPALLYPIASFALLLRSNESPRPL